MSAMGTCSALDARSCFADWTMTFSHVALFLPAPTALPRVYCRLLRVVGVFLMWNNLNLVIIIHALNAGYHRYRSIVPLQNEEESPRACLLSPYVCEEEVKMASHWCKSEVFPRQVLRVYVGPAYIRTPPPFFALTCKLPWVLFDSPCIQTLVRIPDTASLPISAAGYHFGCNILGSSYVNGLLRSSTDIRYGLPSAIRGRHEAGVGECSFAANCASVVGDYAGASGWPERPAIPQPQPVSIVPAPDLHYRSRWNGDDLAPGVVHPGCHALDHRDLVWVFQRADVGLLL